MKLPQYFGHLTNDLIWRRIGSGVTESTERTPEQAWQSEQHASLIWTCDQVGKRELLLHLGTVVGLMKINTDYDETPRPNY